MGFLFRWEGLDLVGLHRCEWVGIGIGIGRCMGGIGSLKGRITPASLSILDRPDLTPQKPDPTDSHKQGEGKLPLHNNPTAYGSYLAPLTPSTPRSHYLPTNYPPYPGTTEKRKKHTTNSPHPPRFQPPKRTYIGPLTHPSQVKSNQIK